MSKAVSAALKAHMAGSTTTLAHCWLVTRGDNIVYGFTDCDIDLLIGGISYKAKTGFIASANKTSAQLNVDNLEVQGMFSSDALTERDLMAGLWDFAQIQLFIVNYRDLTMGLMYLRRGWLGQVNTTQTGFITELRGLMQKLQQKTGRSYLAACDVDLGDSKCKINLATFPNGTVTGSITSVTSGRVFADSALTQADDWFGAGVITFTSGSNNGISMELKTFTSAGGVIGLELPMPFTVNVGDTYSMIAGCRKRRVEDCAAKFSNAINHHGFDLIPGLDNVIAGT